MKEGAGRILLVEDEEEIVELLKIRFLNGGYELLTAGDGEEGLRLAREEKPDLIILDLMLPKIDGFRVCRMLKFDNRFKSIPVIILTGRAEEKDRELGSSVGADAYITKPFEWEELSKTIKGLINKKQN